MRKFPAQFEVPTINAEGVCFAGSSALPRPEESDWDEADTIDGTAAGLKSFLRSLVELTSQCDASQTGPVLELLFSDIVTVTSVVNGKNGDCLSVTAFLPRAQDDIASQHATLFSPQPPAGKHHPEILWDADEGRYVFIREIPVTHLRDERSVMDAVLTTSEQATAWYSANFSPPSALLSVLV